jgi:hypothetical protein
MPNICVSKKPILMADPNFVNLAYLTRDGNSVIGQISQFFILCYIFSLIPIKKITKKIVVF